MAKQLFKVQLKITFLCSVNMISLEKIQCLNLKLEYNVFFFIIYIMIL